MNHRDQFVQFFFERIKHQDYVLLKHTGEIGKYADIDLLFDPGKIVPLIPTICNQPMIENHELQKQESMWQLFLYFKDDSFLQIDFLFGFFRKEMEYLNREEVLDQSVVDANGYRICNPFHLAEHVFLFNLLNHAGISEKYGNLFAAYQTYQQNEINTYLSRKISNTKFFLPGNESF